MEGRGWFALTVVRRKLSSSSENLLNRNQRMVSPSLGRARADRRRDSAPEVHQPSQQPTLFEVDLCSAVCIEH